MRVPAPDLGAEQRRLLGHDLQQATLRVQEHHCLIAAADDHALEIGFCDTRLGELRGGLGPLAGQ